MSKDNYSKLNELSPELTYHEQVKQDQRLIIDEYFNNGFNGSKAVTKYKPELTNGAARVLFTALSKDNDNKVYIQAKRNEIRASVNIEQETVIQNLITWIQADATDYLELSPAELKKLPNEARQSIASITHRKKSYKDRQGQTVVEEVLQIKLIDKIKTLDMLNRMMGYYEIDNRQKSKTLDLSKATPEQLNTVLSLMTQQAKDSEPPTIDLNDQ